MKSARLFNKQDFYREDIGLKVYAVTGLKIKMVGAYQKLATNKLNQWSIFFYFAIHITK